MLDHVDAIITDPPYGINAGKMNMGGARTSRMDKIDWDREKVNLAPFLEMDKPMIVWGGNYYALPIKKGWLVWDKGNGFKGRSFSECELAWSNLPINSKTYLYAPLEKGDYKNKEHPTQKPLTIMNWCLFFIPEAKTVLDPFMGSGTTGVACVYQNKRFIGIEKEERYFNIAVERIKQAVSQGKFDFDEEPNAIWK
jgi:DNA modification methylase